MKNLAISLAAGASALFMTAASAAPRSRRRNLILRSFLATKIALVATGAQAYSTVSPRDNWSALSSAALRRYPPAVREALRAAQKSCGGDEIRVRPGLVSYSKSPAGEEVVAVHFDKFYCLHEATLCSSDGCQHRVFVARHGSTLREVWRGQAHEIDMSVGAGQPAINVNCRWNGSSCDRQIMWSGHRFR